VQFLYKAIMADIIFYKLLFQLVGRLGTA